MKEKQCNACKNTKPHSEFYKNKKMYDGLNGICKTCNKRLVFFNSMRTESYLPTCPLDLKHGYRRCYTCNRTRLVSEFSEDNRTRDGLSSECIPCQIRWREKQKKLRVVIQKKRHIIWPSVKKQPIEGKRKRRNAWFKAKRNADPRYKINCIVSSSIWKGLKNGKEGKSWKSLVDFTLDELMIHLEKQFVDGMTFENHGPVWHIDHIVPKDAFNFVKATDEDFKRCWSLENLQPLFVTENLQKSNKLSKPFQPSLVFG